ncbi:MAG: DNA-3-methyladenine glycosylase family protein [bacterium]|jgi:DNA-3-methyladenine glycosylase II
MEVFEYGQTEIEHLSRKDKKLAAAIAKIGIIKRQVIPDLFTALIRNIVGQQISNKAAATVWARLSDVLGEVTPDRIMGLDVVDIQQCGMSMRKATYIKGVADAVKSGRIDLSAIATMPDDQVIKQLCTLPGVGVWTAEMLLIFSLKRPDVVSWGDLALRRGMMNLYGCSDLSKEQFDRYRRRYSPYGSVASLYLWALSAG